MILYVGLTGLPASGKGTVADILEEWADQLSVCCFRYSLSDEIRYRLREEGIPISRQSLTQHATDLRKAYGSGVLARFVVRRMQQEIQSDTLTPALALIDAIRNPGEVDELQNSLGNQFRLLAVRATGKTIRLRLQARQREGESLVNLHNLLEAEWGINSSKFELNIGACTEMADWQIWNDGSKQDLREHVQAMAEKQILPLMRTVHVGDR
jgi:dephospho-CoA kinase